MPKKSNAKLIIDIFASKVSLLILGSLTVWLGYSVMKEAYRKHQVQIEIEALKREILELEQRNTTLSSFLDSFEDSKTVELEAKRRLNLKKPQEEVAVVIRDENNSEQGIAQMNYYDNKSGDGNDMNAGIAGIESRGKIFANPLKWWQYINIADLRD